MSRPASTPTLTSVENRPARPAPTTPQPLPPHDAARPAPAFQPGPGPLQPLPDPARPGPSPQRNAPPSPPRPSPPRPSTRWLRRTAVALAALAGAGANALWFGARSYDVGATTPHSAPLEWALRQGMETSVRARARSVLIPEGTDLQDPRLAERAIGHYSVACAPCHAAPGHPAAPWMVLYPAPSDLTRPEVVSRWSDSELYWIIKNGIKDTGMIALGPTHSEQDLWAVSAFVRQLPEMSSERYHELVTQYRAQRSTAAPAHHR